MDEFDVAAVIPLNASRPVSIALDSVVAALEAPEIAWLGPASDGGAGRRTFRADLRLPIKAAGRDIEFHKAALVDLGPVKRSAERIELDIAWRSATLAPLFPVFAGRLILTTERITLDGWYAPPGGRVGVALDRLLLGIAARRTAAWLLRLVAENLDSTPARSEQHQHAEDDDQQRPQRAQLRHVGQAT